MLAFFIPSGIRFSMKKDRCIDLEAGWKELLQGEFDKPYMQELELFFLRKKNKAK